MHRQFFSSAGMLGLTSLLLVHSAFGTVPNGPADGKLHPLPIHTDTTRNIVDALSSRHYISATLNDELSSRIFDAYIEDMDPSRSYFLQSDVDEFEKYRYLMDNDLRRGDIDAAFQIFNRYHERLIYRLAKIVETLKSGLQQFDFSVDESLILDRSEEAWASKNSELDELWRKRLKNSVLNLKLSDKEDDKILDLLLKRYENRLSRSKQTNSEDVYQLYMNAFTSTYDPHTQYFSPRTAENFNINMSLSLEGIGAVLQREEEFTKVVSLVPAGPADKSSLLHPDDKIIAVGQGIEGDMVDVIGWRLDEVVQLVRGKKNSVVRLEIIENDVKDQSSHIIEITRNTVKLEEQSAKSEIIEIEQFGHVHKIGVIDIPTFYIDFKALQQGDKNYKSTTRDVRSLLRELKQAEVDGVIIDLRDNGGGSLQEANYLTGLFINRGPTVQIRTKSNRVDLLYDRDARTTYDGPLAVLVNRLSASASEIFAGAIQDYQRGLVIGSQTFGKGTVQSLIPLNRGQLKLTQAKFYRISGESTQHQGIIPDILFPASYDSESIGESTLDQPLPWDRIKATDYQLKSGIGQAMTELRSLHEQRTRNDPEFAFMQDALQYRKELNDENEITLNQEARIKRKESTDTFWVALENKKRVAQGLDPISSLDDLDDNHPTEPQTATSGVTSPATTEDAAAQDSEDTLQGNEMAGLNPIVTDVSAPEEPEGPAIAEDPDAYLLETGTILLNMKNLPTRTAEKGARDTPS
jgi:carboxyl-terminal processing protease